MPVQKNKSLFLYLIAVTLSMGLLGCSTATPSGQNPVLPAVSTAQEFDSTSIYSHTLKDIEGWSVALSRYRGKVLLVVNVASECRFTHQYSNLQRLYMKYRDRGFLVLGFPTNNFGRQEPGSNAEIKEFTDSQFNIKFPLFSKISVAGEDMEPLYQCLTSPETSGKFAGPITWNFNKFLIDKDGTVIARFPSEVDPLDPQITEAIEAVLE